MRLFSCFALSPAACRLTFFLLVSFQAALLCSAMPCSALLSSARQANPHRRLVIGSSASRGREPRKT
ncbi:hypothetical protein LZ31DRAFT_554360 [Colletotrichum somersetense]|nr:hypothetical protein LZ31DRAFT_554360 [Colletotrichum somersetense]